MSSGDEEDQEICPMMPANTKTSGQVVTTHSSITASITTVAHHMLSQWGIVIVIIALGMSHFRPQLLDIVQKMSPSAFAWLNEKFLSMSAAGSAVQTPAAPSTKAQQVVVAKLSALGAKVYGSMHCSWT
jgi:hypothetical protein